MFEFLFKYPPAAYAKGHIVFLAGWPAWSLILVLLAVVLVAVQWRRAPHTRLTGARRWALWLLQTAFLALLLLLIGRPALSVATLKPQQNIVAVLIDDSRSMAEPEGEDTRLGQVRRVLSGGLLEGLRSRFQLRLYSFGHGLRRIQKPDETGAAEQATHIGEALRSLAAEAAGLPVGAVVLLSDGADTGGGIDRDTVAELRARRIPVHAMGFGRERYDRDLELAGVELATRALPGARLTAAARLRHSGYSRGCARLTVRDSGKVLASREIVLTASEQSESLVFAVGPAGPHRLEFALQKLDGEQNPHNNAIVRLVNVEDLKPRILYLEGEPRWEFKFIRRAVEEDHGLQLTTILRTTENKLYRQGISDPKELEQGFPAKPEELFAFRGLVIGSVESGYFTPAQQELIRDFADRRGGGVLFLGGRHALAEGGWSRPPVGELLPVALPERKGTFHRDRARVELTAAGRESLICRLTEPAEANVERWQKLPALADYQEAGQPKPGALVLAQLESPDGRRLPLLVTQNYGHGRVALLATGGSWRWQMLQELSDQTHEMFWQQLLRWLVTGAPGQVSGSTPLPVLEDESRVILRAEVRDKAFRPLRDARVEARIVGPEGQKETVWLEPAAHEPGVYQAEWKAERAGGYSAEILASRGEEQIGRDMVLLRREDGVAENFHALQDRELLQTLAAETGGRYYRPSEASRLAKEITYSEAGISVRETHDLWDMPLVFLLALSLRFAEWLLRRNWGAV